VGSIESTRGSANATSSHPVSTSRQTSRSPLLVFHEAPDIVTMSGPNHVYSSVYAERVAREVQLAEARSARGVAQSLAQSLCLCRWQPFGQLFAAWGEREHGSSSSDHEQAGSNRAVSTLEFADSDSHGAARTPSSVLSGAAHPLLECDWRLQQGGLSSVAPNSDTLADFLDTFEPNSEGAFDILSKEPALISEPHNQSAILHKNLTNAHPDGISDVRLTASGLPYNVGGGTNHGSVGVKSNVVYAQPLTGANERQIEAVATMLEEKRLNARSLFSDDPAERERMTSLQAAWEIADQNYFFQNGTSETVIIAELAKPGDVDSEEDPPEVNEEAE